MPEFTLVSNGRDLPVVTFAVDSEVTKYDVYDVSRKVRERGWLVPAYTTPMPHEAQPSSFHR